MELSPELNATLEKVSRSIEVTSPKSLLVKEKYIKQQKLLNHLIDIYQSKAKHPSPKSMVSKKALQVSSSLPFIYRLYPSSERANRAEREKRQISLVLPTVKKEVQRERLNRLREVLIDKAKQKAKEQKEYMLILNDNLHLYKESMRLENINKRNIVLSKRKLIDESIINYKLFKRGYIDKIIKYDISQLNLENSHKKSELAYWKKQSEEKMKKSNSMSNYLFMTQNPI